MKERLTGALRDAMKSKDKRRVSVLRMILADITNIEKSGKDFEYIDVVSGYAKKLKKTIEEYERLQIQKEIDSCKAELEIVEEFLPRQMSDEELENAVTELIEAERPGSVGLAMKVVMAKYRDVADGKKVQSLVKKIFSNNNS